MLESVRLHLSRHPLCHLGDILRDRPVVFLRRVYKRVGAIVYCLFETVTNQRNYLLLPSSMASMVLLSIEARASRAKVSVWLGHRSPLRFQTTVCIRKQP